MSADSFRNKKDSLTLLSRLHGTESLYVDDTYSYDQETSCYLGPKG